MAVSQGLILTSALAPAALMAMLSGALCLGLVRPQRQWRVLQSVSVAALLLALTALLAGAQHAGKPGLILPTSLGLALAVLVQLLGTVIGRFSARYLEGEQAQQAYIAALAAVLASVHLLLLADHWLLLLLAWAAVGVALQHLLCFYRERPFALLAAHKKRLADRLADVLLIGAMLLAWHQVSSGSLSALWAHLAQHGMSTALQLSALLLVLAVILRTALLPVHGWLIQVMEAPTPVSALLHAGVVNLGGFVLIRFAPLMNEAMPARSLLLAMGLGTALLAGMVMLTRISIKVRLAWSTVAQMGFMLLECALGLYTLAALHLLGHSLYKAHAFLSASSVVRSTRLQTLHGQVAPAMASLLLAPVLASAGVLAVQAASPVAAWPWWWSLVLGLALAPMLWLPAGKGLLQQLIFGLVCVLGLSLAATAAHALPLGLNDAADARLGLLALAGMSTLYACQILMQTRPHWLAGLHRWSYAGFYLDEAYTRLALRVWPARWTVGHTHLAMARPSGPQFADSRH